MLIAPVAFALSRSYGAFFRVTPEVPGCDRWTDKEVGSTTCQKRSLGLYSLTLLYLDLFLLPKVFVCEKYDPFESF